MLALFVRGRVYLHFEYPDDVVGALAAAGFAAAEVERAADVLGAPGGDRASNLAHDRAFKLAHILEASSR